LSERKEGLIYATQCQDIRRVKKCSANLDLDIQWNGDEHWRRHDAFDIASIRKLVKVDCHSTTNGQRDGKVTANPSLLINWEQTIQDTSDWYRDDDIGASTLILFSWGPQESRSLDEISKNVPIDSFLKVLVTVSSSYYLQSLQGSPALWHGVYWFSIVRPRTGLNFLFW
jgi:hypothetical protein